MDEEGHFATLLLSGEEFYKNCLIIYTCRDDNNSGHLCLHGGITIRTRKPVTLFQRNIRMCKHNESAKDRLAYTRHPHPYFFLVFS